VLKSRILVVDDDSGVRVGVRTYLETYGYEIAESETCADALERLRGDVPDVVLVDNALPDGNALDVIRAMKEAAIDVPVIVLTGHGTIDLAVTAMREGAEHFLTKPVEMASLTTVIDRVLEHQQNLRRVRATRARAVGPAHGLFSGNSTAMRVLARDARSIASGEAPVLIEGETGTGKSVLAWWIHDASPRARESFVELTCAGLPRELVESEMFGYEQGTFIGATGVKGGLIESAHRGTMFVDEIGDVDLAIQPTLLKVIEEKKFRRPGEGGERRVDVRFIAATNRPLAGLVDEGKFLEDLFYRINSIVLRLPPLRDRKEDIPGIARQLLPQLARDTRRPPPSLDADAERALMEHTWPGNVRELRNVLERAVMLTAGPLLRRADLRLLLAAARPDVNSGTGAAVSTLKDVEWQYIRRVLAEENDNVPRAAQRLGVPRSTLYQRLKAQGIRPGR
jgi:DNA-binding NtrC family response regulator